MPIIFGHMSVIMIAHTDDDDNRARPRIIGRCECWGHRWYSFEMVRLYSIDDASTHARTHTLYQVLLLFVCLLVCWFEWGAQRFLVRDLRHPTARKPRKAPRMCDRQSRSPRDIRDEEVMWLVCCCYLRRIRRVAAASRDRWPGCLWSTLGLRGSATFVSRHMHRLCCWLGFVGSFLGVQIVRGFIGGWISGVRFNNMNALDIIEVGGEGGETKMGEHS